MDSSLWFDTTHLGYSIVYTCTYIQGFQVKFLEFFRQKIFLTFTNSVHPDEMQ